ncbi:hypothetical protein Fot_42378 [Forsythia ovata]|uniref:Uncharacterized protein n=1 Tax=Forsythia ovata TaxID=205694 RepID=A0ABD1RLN9_9LAMI
MTSSSALVQRPANSPQALPSPSPRIVCQDNVKEPVTEEALVSKIEKLVVSEPSLKVQLLAAQDDVKRVESRVMALEEARRLAETRAVLAENSIAFLNRDYDAMVIEKESWLAKANGQLVRVNEELAEVISQ